MTLTSILLQAVASLLAIITFLIVLNVQRSMLLPGGIFGNGCLAPLSCAQRTNQCYCRDLYRSSNWFCISQILSIVYKTPAVVFVLAILAPLVPGYLSHRTTAFFVTGDYSHALTSATLVVMLALVISIGMASGTVILKLYYYIRNNEESLPNAVEAKT